MLDRTDSRPRTRIKRTFAPIVIVSTYSDMERLVRACMRLRLARKRLQKRLQMREQREREREFKADPVYCFPVWLADSIASTFADDVEIPEDTDKNLLMLDDREYRTLIGEAIARATTKAALPKILGGAPRPFKRNRSRLRKVGAKRK